MISVRRILPWVCVTALLVLAPDTTRAQDDPNAAAAREWNQAGGNAGHTSSLAFEPVRSKPSVVWRRELWDGSSGSDALLAGPVTWGGIAYLVAGSPKSRDLLAFRIEDGEPAGRRRLGRGGPLALSVWQGTVVLAESSKLRGLPHKKDKFGMGWTVKPARGAVVGGVPVIHGGVAYSATFGEVDVRTGRRKAWTSGGFGRPSVATDGDGRIVVAAPWVRVRGATASGGGTQSFVLVTAPPSKIGKGATVESGARMTTAASLTIPVDPDTRAGVRVMRLAPTGSIGAKGAWIVLTSPGPGPTGPFKTAVCRDTLKSRKGRTLRFLPAAAGGRAYGFDSYGSLVSMNTRGKGATLMEAGRLPSGATPGPASAAGEVVYLGSWAFDTALARVLWTAPELKPVTPLIPVGDARVLCVTEDGHLTLLADGVVAAAAAPSGRETAGADGTDGETAPPPSVPRSVDGVLLRDGRQFPGRFDRLDDDRVRVLPTDGEPFEVDESEIALAVDVGLVEIAAEPFELVELWKRAVYGGWVEVLVERFEVYRKAQLLTQCRRVLDEARRFGLGATREGDLKRLLANRREHPNADLRFRKLEPQEEALRSEVFASLLAGSAWFEKLEFPTAATVLLGEADLLVPGREEISVRASALVPPSFPFRKKRDVGREWILWARELLPAGGEFLDEDEPAWNRANFPPWSEGAVALRTRNVIFFSMCHDRAVVGACLRNAEGAVRACQVLLKEGRVDNVVSDRDRLDVRLHRNRRAYLAEKTPIGSAMPWSAGYYSPMEGVSRFYVPGAAGTSAPLARNLYKVLSHELTHHYIDQRWIRVNGGVRGGGPGQPGYWVVEGMARFVEDQAVEMGRRGVRFDLETVTSLDTAAQVEGADKLFPLGEFVDLSQGRFATLDNEATFTVRLRNTVRRPRLSALHVFYEQAGSLVFFLMNRRGDDGRTRLVDYMRSYYRGGSRKEGWKALGFDTAEDLDKEFRTFLRGLND